MSGTIDENEIPMKRIWDNFEDIGEVQTTGHKKIVVSSALRDGLRFINIREFVKTEETVTFIPTSNGMTLILECPRFDAIKNERLETLFPLDGLVDLMRKAAEHVYTMELYDDAKAVFVPQRRRK